VKKSSGPALIIACLALALHFVHRSNEIVSPPSPPPISFDNSEALSSEILAKGLGYSWHPIDLDGPGTATMIGVGRSTDGKFSGSNGSLPEDRNEPLFLFYKIEDNWLHFSVVSSTSRFSSKLPVLLPTDTGPAGMQNSTPSGMPIKVGTAFVSVGMTDNEGKSSAGLPPDYAAGNIGFAVFVK